MKRFFFILGFFLTIIVTIALGILDILTLFGEPSARNNFTDQQLPGLHRWLALFGLLWVPAVAGNLDKTDYHTHKPLSFRQHFHATFQSWTLWGLVVVVAVAVTTAAAAVTGEYWWFAAAVASQMVWGFRSGVVTRRHIDWQVLSRKRAAEYAREQERAKAMQESLERYEDRRERDKQREREDQKRWEANRRRRRLGQ